MQKHHLIFVFCLGLVACSHSEVKKEKGVRFSLPAFLQLSTADLKPLLEAVRRTEKSQRTLSDGNQADCANRQCTIKRPPVSVTLKPEDIRAMETLSHKARLSKKKEVQVSGPVTLSCTSQACQADLLFESEQPLQVRTEGESEASQALFSGFVQGVVQKALSPR